MLNLSGNASMRLSQFACTGAAPSALLHIARGGLAFVAGAIAKTDQFVIETPLASMRRRARSDGLGFLSFAGFLFATMEEVHAAGSGVAFLDDGTIAYKDLEHGIFELVTKEASPRHIFVDDPGETIVLRRVGSSISESHVTNSVTQMAQFEAAQQEALHIFSLGLQGPTATGAGGSSSPPSSGPPAFVQPINFIQPDSGLQLTIPDNGPGADGHTPTSSDFFFFFIPPAPPAPPGTVIERVNVTGDTALDSTTGTLALGGRSFSKSAPTFVWSGGDLTADQISTLAAASALTVTPSGTGTANVSFSAPDNVFDFLAAGETLTITYKVTANGGNNASVTITIVGTNDAPELAADASGTYHISELVCHTNDYAPDTVTGSLHFTDPDLTDTHTVAATIASVDWSGGGPLPDGLNDVLANALSLTEVDSSGSGDGSVGFKFCAADRNFDFLAAGETLTVTYNVSVTDDHGVSAVQPVTITVTGSNDAPVLAADCSGPHEITERAGTTGDAVDLDTTSGTLHFSDADLDDTHCVTSHLCSVTTSGGCALPDGLTDVLANALVLTEDDSTGSGSGTVDFKFAAADENFDFLAAGQTLTVVYDVTVADGHGGSSTRPVTITITGTND
ncbi:MAG TPA: VCBS domain-containing protein, partial [Pseudolabrys sp.]|nr:VCBS domain-containing protein [Pseudolabrys sp.]